MYTSRDALVCFLSSRRQFSVPEGRDDAMKLAGGDCYLNLATLGIVRAPLRSLRGVHVLPNPLVRLAEQAGDNPARTTLSDVILNTC